MMMSRREWFFDYVPFKLTVSIGLGDNRVTDAVGSGLVRVSMSIDSKMIIYKLCDVYYVHNIGTNNLLSVTYMIEKNYTVSFGWYNCRILKERGLIGKVTKRDKL